MQRNTKLVVGAFALTVFALVAPAHAAVKALACGGVKTITSEAAKLSAGDVLQVSGTCTENVSIPANVNNVRIEGVAGARVQAATADSVFIVRGRAILITGFIISGGTEGVLVVDGGFAWIAGNTIEANSSNGVQVSFASTARIWDNVIRNNAATGVLVSRSSSALIGLSSTVATTPTPNTITGNGLDGVLVFGSAHATVVANTISDNGANGVVILRGGQAEIASNVISNNGGSGIEAAHNSTVSLGSNSGSGLRDLPNSGSNNVGFGLRCTGGGYANGRIGSLMGNQGQIDIAACAGVVNP